ncbi:MAG: superoxide dismutase, Fe-Mn family [Solirubrobacteraceae bacterium]|jgi:Fe-Mn family superoxide dismutase|nr:superoxide dismutase, Fe-Mn family [Solirubrobacteraceae bacterium]MEA2232202.1 superoxide dismutase, Fe-Mn family [Solirubrobacteraceae bacterium]
MMCAMAYKVPDLPYAYDALEPHISEEIMRVHHDKHHQAYVDKANAALAGTEWEDVRPKEILTRLDELPENLRDVVRNNAGGQYNHCMLWRSMTPDGGGQPPADSKLMTAMKDAFRSFAVFKDTMTQAAMSQFGSGWAWLVHDGTRVLIVTTSNQDNPISDGLTPLLGVDVWEHAYYLQYENRRQEYVEAWFNVINWETVAQRFAEAPVPDVSELLLRPVSIGGKDKRFGDVTMEEARAQGVELGALAGWGPMAKVGAVARGWEDLAKTLSGRGATTVADLDPGIVEAAAKELWIVLPGRSMV